MSKEWAEREKRAIYKQTRDAALEMLASVSDNAAPVPSEQEVRAGCSECGVLAPDHDAKCGSNGTYPTDEEYREFAYQDWWAVWPSDIPSQELRTAFFAGYDAHSHAELKERVRAMTEALQKLADAGETWTADFYEVKRIARAALSKDNALQ